jgi:hypothetical protein
LSAEHRLPEIRPEYAVKQELIRSIALGESLEEESGICDLLMGFRDIFKLLWGEFSLK